MPKISLFVPPNSNIEKESLQAASQEVRDGFLDESGALRKRPGLLEFADLGTSSEIKGLYYWEERGLLLAVSGADLYTIGSDAVVTRFAPSVPFTGTRKATFAPIKPGGVQKIMIANGGPMYIFDGATVTQVADVDAPRLVSHVGFIDQYIVANSLVAADSSKFFFSNVNDPTAWDTVDFSDVEARPDDLTALDVGWREIIAAGPRSIEFYYNDGTTPFSRIDGAAINGGIGAPYTLKFVNNTWHYLDAHRRFVRLEGRTPQIISKPIDRTIQGLSVVSDAVSDIIEANGRHFYVTSFPTVEKTFVYDLQLDYWSQWNKWDTSTGGYKLFAGQHSTWHRSLGKWMIGDRLNGKIYEVSGTTYQDDSLPIRTSIITPFIDFGTHNRKRSNRLSFTVKAGDGKDGGNSAPTFAVKYRDSSTSAFGNTRNISMGDRGDTFSYRELRRNGIYRSRQYEIAHSDNSPFMLTSAEEEAELLAT